MKQSQIEKILREKQESAFKNGKSCGKVIAQELPTSKQIKGLARYTVDARTTHNDILLQKQIQNKFTEGYIKGYAEETEKLPLAKRIRNTIKHGLLEYHEIKYMKDLIASSDPEKYWNIK